MDTIRGLPVVADILDLDALWKTVAASIVAVGAAIARGLVVMGQES